MITTYEGLNMEFKPKEDISIEKGAKRIMTFLLI
jgi:hypothetical protein